MNTHCLTTKTVLNNCKYSENSHIEVPNTLKVLMEMTNKKRNIIMVSKTIKMYSDIRSMTFKRNCLKRVKQQIPINILST